MKSNFELGPSARGRGKRLSVHQPYRQGDLDGLCGVYSVVNALRAVAPEMDEKLSARLFRHLVKCLRGRAEDPLGSITGGIEHPTLGRLLKIAIGFVDRKRDITITARGLPERVRATKRVDRLWRELSTVLSPTSVAIFSVQGRMSHWTVATRIGDKHLFLRDSGDLKRFRRTHCTVGEADGCYSIAPGEVVIVEREN
jgi:hypothetical protein